MRRLRIITWSVRFDSGFRQFAGTVPGRQRHFAARRLGLRLASPTLTGEPVCVVTSRGPAPQAPKRLVAATDAGHGPWDGGRRISVHEKNSGNSYQRPEQNKTQRERHAPHNAQKVDFKLERDIVHTGDGGPMTETTVGTRLSDGGGTSSTTTLFFSPQTRWTNKTQFFLTTTKNRPCFTAVTSPFRVSPPWDEGNQHSHKAGHQPKDGGMLSCAVPPPCEGTAPVEKCDETPLKQLHRRPVLR